MASLAHPMRLVRSVRCAATAGRWRPWMEFDVSETDINSAEFLWNNVMSLSTGCWSNYMAHRPTRSREKPQAWH